MADFLDVLNNTQKQEQPVQPNQARIPSNGLIETLLQLLNVKGIKPHQAQADQLNQIDELSK